MGLTDTGTYRHDWWLADCAAEAAIDLDKHYRICFDCNDGEWDEAEITWTGKDCPKAVALQREIAHWEGKLREYLASKP